MNPQREKDFEARLFLKCAGFRKEEHAPREPAKQALLDEMFVERARRHCLLRISDNEYVCREIFKERFESGTLPNTAWSRAALALFEQYR